MTKKEIQSQYFDWMYRLVHRRGKFRKQSYRKLMHYLDRVDFTYTIGNDGNRAEDGVGLRYRFGYEFSYEQQMIAAYLDDRPCSVLEMMVALSLRIEEHIMEDFDPDDRTNEWFWNMVVSMGLSTMDDTCFSEQYAECIVTRFLNRDYWPNGEGSLFTIRNCERDMRKVEIWYQMNYFINSIS